MYVLILTRSRRSVIEGKTQTSHTALLGYVKPILCFGHVLTMAGDLSCACKVRKITHRKDPGTRTDVIRLTHTHTQGKDFLFLSISYSLQMHKWINKCIL